MKDKEKIINKIVDFYNKRDFESARKLIDNDLRRIGNKDEYYFYLALVTESNIDKLELYSKAIQVNANYLDAYINRGLVYNELKEYENSIVDYTKAIELDSKCALAYNNRGYTKYKQQDYKGALADYNKAILLNPKLKIALDNKAQLFLDVCMEDDKDFSEKYYFSLAVYDINQGNFIEAIKDLDEVLIYNSKSANTYFYKGVAYHSLGKNDDAYDNYTKAIELDKKMIDAYYNRGQLIYKSEPKKALDDFVQAVALDPKFADAYYSIAAIQKNLGEYDNAIKNLDKVIEIEPQAVNAKALKKLILTKYLNNK